MATNNDPQTPAELLTPLRHILVTHKGHDCIYRLMVDHLSYIAKDCPDAILVEELSWVLEYYAARIVSVTD